MDLERAPGYLEGQPTRQAMKPYPAVPLLAAAFALAAWLPIVLVLGMGCAREARQERASLPEPDSASVARARAAAGTLAGDLQTQLLGALDRGGPLAAVAYCADSAQALTARHQADGIAVRRVGTRLRNPANAPDSLERALLAAFKIARAIGTLPAETVLVVLGADGTPELRYLKPIVIQERCLTCHGARAAIPEPVRRLIAERYPADSATGYRAGDLRGAVTARLPLEGRLTDDIAPIPRHEP